MSLDVYLQGQKRKVPCRCSRCEHEHERDVTDEFYDANITHNLTRMADAAGIYQHLWRPDEIGITVAADLIQPLRDGLARLRDEPEYFKSFNPSNGWGDYDGLVRFVQRYLAACEEHPDATVHVSR